MKQRSIKDFTTLIALITTSLNLNAMPNPSFENSELNEVVMDHLANISDEEAAAIISALYKEHKITINLETGSIRMNANVIDVLKSQGRVTELPALAGNSSYSDGGAGGRCAPKTP